MPRVRRAASGARSEHCLAAAIRHHASGDRIQLAGRPPPVRVIEDPWYVSDIERRHREYEQRFQTTDLNDEDSVAVLRGLGLDFRDEHGRPLRCMMLLARQAEAAAKGIAGKLPDPVAARDERWETGLAEAAEAFMASKRRRRGAGAA